MRGLTTAVLMLAAFAAGAMLTGCGSNEAVQQEQQASAGAASPEVPAEVAAELDKLPEADRELVAAQRICPVTGELLGSMGKPIRLTVDGREVFICCAGCEDSLREEPEKYFSKLDGEGS